MKFYYRILLVTVLASVSLTSTALAGLNVNLNIGIPVQPVVPAPAPTVIISDPPDFIMPPSLGFYVSVGGPVDLFQVNNVYFMYRDSRWFQGANYNGPWINVPHRNLPMVLRRHRYEEIREIRDEEYRDYRAHRDDYRGRHFRPERMDADRREERHERREERRDDRYDDRHDNHHDNGRGGERGNGWKHRDHDDND